MNCNEEKQSAEDQYLDLIICLAFERKADLEIKQLIDEPDPVLSEKEKAITDTAFQKALSEEEKRNHEERRTRAARNFRKFCVGICKVAACLIIVASITLSIAIATSAQFRSKVMQLLVDIDTVNNEARFSYIENENAAFYVPQEWTGEWYMSYIPSDLSLTSIQSMMQYAEYSDGNERKLRFSEMGEENGVMIGTENTTITNITVSGQIGWMIIDNSEEQAIAIVWSNENKWFKLSSYCLSQEELITIADKIRKINK